VAVFVIKASGKHEMFSQTVQLSETWSPVRFHFKRTFTADDQFVRFAIYPLTEGVSFDVDETFLAALPD
jgi:hypothetical protein